MADHDVSGTSTARTRIVASRPSWSRGAARLMDIGGTLRAYRLQPVPQRTDADAIAGDWQRVGMELRSAMQAIDPAKAK